MEKMGVVRPDVTPSLEDAAEHLNSADCVKTAVGHNSEATTAALDADFRKQAAEKINTQLNSCR